ncbi:hypothetical protein [Lamprobacter modestohalophilus]|nr:hypothetical protein [Lamprobacter modestohalophilus]
MPTVMNSKRIIQPLIAGGLALGLCLPGAAFAYGENDAIRDCNERMRANYNITDFRSESAEKIPGGGHRYKVVGKTKVDGKKYEYSCEIKDRRVVKLEYNGKEPKGLGTAESLAIGAAAAIAAGIAVSAMSKDKAPAAATTRPAPAPAPAPEVKVRANGEMEVLMANGCTVLYNDIGLRKRYGNSCSQAQLASAKQAMTNHLANQSRN